jgi:AmmeMemoRadiSam system protein A
MAIKAAPADFRFPSLSPEELSRTNIEISVLSPLRKIANIREIKVGSHGLVIDGDGHRGLLLPQVADRYGWSQEEFAAYTCRKAGLPDDYWRDKGTLYLFAAVSFDDGDW